MLITSTRRVGQAQRDAVPSSSSNREEAVDAVHAVWRVKMADDGCRVDAKKEGTAVSEELRERTDGTGSGRLGPRLVPILGWLRSYDRRWLRGDLIAGMTVAALIVPKNLGYAEIAGIPVQNGLYAAAAGAILYAIFGTCRQISMGPSSGLAAVAASAVFAAGITDQQEVASFVAASPWRRERCFWS